ncbi:DUF7527 domain-containing protein [Haloplanus salilacus]|uniref:DUF7527 domain-containing protein n=1 Tax=Haloplanus salilacus TaxID=2949994 RepID=UPI0030D1B4DE
MDGEILDAVTEWGTRSVGDGVSGLYTLADADFSGAVTDGTAWAFFLNGRVVGVFDGDVDDFEDASLTAYTAPDISLPLLYTMQVGGGETRGQYYSNETPLSEIDDTLSTGNFVGYVELSENVLSGDYYVVYYGGRSLPVAFVGNEPRLLTGDEAFDRAADEVGIYSVVDADVTVVDLPDRPDPVDEGTGTAVAAGAVDSEDSDGTVVEGAAGDDEETVEEGTTDRSPSNAGTGDDAGGGVSTDTVADDDRADAPGDGTVSESPDVDLEPAVEASTDASETASTEPDVTDADDSAVTESTASGTPAVPTDVGAAGETETESDVGSDTPDASTAGASVPDHDASDEVDRLRHELADVRDTLAETASERDEYREEVERLRDRIERLEAGRTETDPDSGTERTLAPEEAIAGTNLFVRYEDKSGATVERAAAGRVPPEELRANLRIEYHTEFETADVRVDGRPFEAFLRGTVEHRFTEWLLTELLYEIRRVDAGSGVSKLYEAVERIDRIDLDGEVAVDTSESDADADAEGTAVSFDVVCRDKMGDPLFVADFSDSRDPTRAPTIESILDGATSVGRSTPSLAAAAVVTTSFFDADAMEAAVDATRGGLFSRSSRRSYVKISRKHGFHLCLIEARDEDFFLTVPDL